MADTVLLLVGAAAAFLFGWNNSGLLIGNTRGSGALTVRESLAISSLGLMLGVLAEGSKMANSINGGLVSAPTGLAVLVALVVTVILTLGLTLARLPVSLSMTVVGAFGGTAIGLSLHIDPNYLLSVLAFWFLAPVAAAVLSFALDLTISHFASLMSLLSVDALNRMGVLASSVAVAYVLGANNIGLIYGIVSTGGQLGAWESVAVIFALGVLAILGMLALGRGSVSGTIGDRLLVLSPQGVFAAFLGSAIVVWVGTQLTLPISITQCLLGAMFGVAFTKRIRVVNRGLAVETVSSWVLVPLSAFLVSLVIALLV